jgi:hypothetical protein
MKKFAAISATAIVLAAGLAAPAQAADFSVSADKSTNLIAAGDTVTVTLANIPTDAGLYVRLCQGTPADAMKGRPANCFGQGAWVSTFAASKAQGAADATAPIKLAVKAQFTSGANGVDCLTQACLIHIRRDHMAPTDFSLDRVIPVTFTAEAPETPAPVAKKPMTKAELKAAIAKKKAALAAAKAKKKATKKN